jgi:hypothetical protein
MALCRGFWFSDATKLFGFPNKYIGNNFLEDVCVSG